jgi:hypothetical protein
MEIRDFRVNDENHIKVLFELVFKQPYSIDLWKWRFEQNPAGQRKIKLMWEGEKLIGQYAVSPLKMKIEGTTLNTSLSLGTMTHPDFEGKGVFKSLAKSLYQQLEEENYAGVWGFPNNNSHGAFIHSLNWKNLGIQHSLSIPASKLKTEKIIQDFTLFEVKRFSNEHSDFIKRSRNLDLTVYVAKDCDYLNWRFVDKPNVTYHRYFGNFGGVDFLIVCKVFFDTQSKKRFLNLLEVYIDDYSILHTILLNIISHIGEAIDFVNVWKSVFDSQHLKFERFGFTLSVPQTYVGIIPFISNSNLLDFRRWNLCMGDSDVF